MGNSECHSPMFYPLLGGVRDFGGFRISGVGLGNSFYTYFHAFVLSKLSCGRLVHPAWPSLKIGPLLRREPSKRFYFGLFQPTADEIVGLEKYIALAGSMGRYNRIRIGEKDANAADARRLNIVSCGTFSFVGLHSHREAIRQRFLEMIREEIPPAFTWGASPYIAVHVRLGDFAPPPDAVSETLLTNTRMPTSWYARIIKHLMLAYPSLPILIVSDGRAQELNELTTLGARIHRTTSDIGDLLTLASASILVGSNSTYSQWAAFLGNMPTIWVSTSNQKERPTAKEIPISYVPIGSQDALNLPMLD